MSTLTGGLTKVRIGRFGSLNVLQHTSCGERAALFLLLQYLRCIETSKRPTFTSYVLFDYRVYVVFLHDVLSRTHICPREEDNAAKLTPRLNSNKSKPYLATLLFSHRRLIQRQSEHVLRVGHSFGTSSIEEYLVMIQRRL